MVHPQQDDFNLEIVFQNFFESVLKARKNSLSATDNTLLELLNGELTLGKFHSNYLKYKKNSNKNHYKLILEKLLQLRFEPITF